MVREDLKLIASFRGCAPHGGPDGMPVEVYEGPEGTIVLWLQDYHEDGTSSVSLAKEHQARLVELLVKNLFRSRSNG